MLGGSKVRSPKFRFQFRLAMRMSADRSYIRDFAGGGNPDTGAWVLTKNGA